MLLSDNISLLIHRISLGKLIFEHNDTLYVLYAPSCELKYESELLYNEFIDNHKFDDWIHKDNIGFLLSRAGLWHSEDDKLIEKTEKSIENYKLSLYLNRMNSSKTKNIRTDLMNTKEQLHKLINRKHSLDYLTLEDFATTKKNEYLLANTLYYKHSNERVFDTNTDIIDHNLFDQITLAMNKHIITIECYKTIARHESWKMIWNANKNNIFNKSAVEFTDEQKTLVAISQMYDKIYEHPDCPGEAVIQDDDMLDGWMIEQKRKNEASKKESANQDLTNKHSKAKEIFVVGDRENIDEINALNSLESKHIIKQRSHIIKRSSDGVDEIQLPDVQQELLQKLNTRK